MIKFNLIGVSTLAMVAWGTAANAAPDSNNGDIVVTATKRAQTLQDVPISVSVTSADTIQKANITDIIDLQSVVPSLKVYQLQNTGQTGFSIRGFGNGTGNPGIEASVGIFIDGVYRSRSASSLSDLPEVERVEVLRGPQSTLFGKNVEVGAVSIVTKAPAFKWGGFAEATLGNYGELLAKAKINAPLSDTLAVSLYGSVDQRDGYTQNITPGVPGKVNDRNRWSLRGDLLWKPTDNFSLRVIADYNKINEVCCTVVSIHNGSQTQFIGAPVAFGGLGKAISNFATNPYQTTTNRLPTNYLVGKGISGEANLGLGFAKLTSITAYREQQYDTSQDVDFTGADLANQTSSDVYKTFTQEFRLTSTGKGPLSWLVGAFYANEDIQTGTNITYGTDSYNYLNTLAGGNVTKLEGALHFLNPAINPTKYFFQNGQGISDNWHMKDTSFSIFGQADYKILPQLTLTGGVAYLHDHKAVVSSVDLSKDPFSLLNLGSTTNPTNPGIPALALLGLNPNVFAGLGALQFFAPPVNVPHGALTLNPLSPTAAFDGTLRTISLYGANIPAESGILNGSKVTFTGRLAYEITKHFNVYASYSTGWKGGAYGLSNASFPVDPTTGYGRSVQPENLTVYELGLKTRFRGGYVNIAAFDEIIKGFQSNAFTGTAFALTNAGKQSVKGFEFDSSFAPVRPLVLGLNATYLDPKYDSFLRASCAAQPTINPCATGVNFHDLSGVTPAGIPKWSVTASAVYNQDFGHGYSGYIRGEYDYASTFQINDTVPAVYGSSGVSVVNASVGFSTPYKLDITFWARNLTKDTSYIATFQTTIQNFGTNPSYSAYPTEPRRYGVTIRKAF